MEVVERWTCGRVYWEFRWRLPNYRDVRALLAIITIITLPLQFQFPGPSSQWTGFRFEFGNMADPNLGVQAGHQKRSWKAKHRLN